MSSETLKHEGAQSIPDFAHTRMPSATVVSYGMPFEIIGQWLDGSPEIRNVTGKRCKGCRNLMVRESMDWKGAIGHCVTIRHCLSFDPCTGNIRRDSL